MGLILGGGSFTGEVMEAKAVRPVATMAEWVVIRYPRRGIPGKSIGGAPGAFFGRPGRLLTFFITAEKLVFSWIELCTMRHLCTTQSRLESI